MLSDTVQYTATYSIFCANNEKNVALADYYIVLLTDNIYKIDQIDESVINGTQFNLFYIDIVYSTKNLRFLFLRGALF